MFNKRLLKNTILFLVLVELLSLTSFIYAPLNAVVFFAILAITLVLSLRKLEWGLYIVLAELFIGSFGGLFSLEIEGLSISIRIGLFVVIMSVWIMKSLRGITLNTLRQAQGITRNDAEDISNVLSSSSWSFIKSKLGKWYLALGIVLVWGLGWGLISNDFANVFFDFNNWLYFLYILPFWAVFTNSSRHPEFISGSNFESSQTLKQVSSNPADRHGDKVKNILTILAASVIVLSIKTILLEWIFAHQVPGIIEMLYRWTRDFRLGEVTFFANNFYRVFLQSQIWLLLGFFIFIGMFVSEDLVNRIKFSKFEIRNLKFEKNSNNQNQKFENKIVLLVLILSSTALIISFSRSLWLGLGVGLIAFFLIILFKLKWRFVRVLKWGFSFLGVLILELIFIFAIINIPTVKDSGSLGSLLTNRLTGLEAAGSSRINLLEPLGREIVNHPVAGSGFGSVVTYKSADPRVVAGTAGLSGEYTTYAFEWSYLDMMLKFGLVGLIVYLGLLFSLFKLSWRQINISHPGLDPGSNQILNRAQNDMVMFGFLLALIALMFTNITTPYLNHPLGIGFVILISIFIYGKKSQ